MESKRQYTQPMTAAEYRAILDQFAEKRARLDNQLVLARQRGETARAANLYRYWQQVVAEQRDFLFAAGGLSPAA